MVTENKTDATYGVAIDLGTTTIAGSLIELSTLKVLRRASIPNPQSKYGKDVISRIEAVSNNPDELKVLQKLIVDAINELIKDLARNDNTVLTAIGSITCAGNSVMEHILNGVSPESMGRIPYKPVFKESRSLRAKDIGITVNDTVEVYTFPMVGGFVGGDAVAATIALDLDTSNGNTLAIDIGTNTEIILRAGATLSATAAAAGPAFEGGEVEAGMAAVDGAISTVTIEGDSVKLDIIGGHKKPLGICGSGLISAVSELLKAGIIDKSGTIRDSEEVETNLASKVHPSDDGNRFTLYRDASLEVAITQADVRALQTAKAAIRAGIETILAKAKINASALKKIFITGAFGSNIDTSALLQIGLLDATWADKIETTEVTENAALKGAEIALTTKGKERIEDIAKKTTYVPLSGTKGFESSFIEHTNFPNNKK